MLNLFIYKSTFYNQSVKLNINKMDHIDLRQLEPHCIIDKKANIYNTQFIKLYIKRLVSFFFAQRTHFFFQIIEKNSFPTELLKF